MRAKARSSSFSNVENRRDAAYGTPPFGGRVLYDSLNARSLRDCLRHRSARWCGRSPATGTPGPDYRAVHAGSLSGSLVEA